MEKLIDKLIEIAMKRLERERTPSNGTLKIIDRIIELNSLTQYRS